MIGDANNLVGVRRVEDLRDILELAQSSVDHVIRILVWSLWEGEKKKLDYY